MNYICDIFFWRNHIARYNCNVYCSIAMRIWFVYSARRKIINQHMTQLGRHHQSLSWNFLVWWSSNDRQIPSFKLSVLRINIEIKIKILCLAVNNWVLFIIFGKKNELIKSFMWLENVPIKNKPQKHRFFFFIRWFVRNSTLSINKWSQKKKFFLSRNNFSTQYFN